VFPTVEAVTARAPRTFEECAVEHAEVLRSARAACQYGRRDCRSAIRARPLDRYDGAWRALALAGDAMLDQLRSRTASWSFGPWTPHA